MIANTPRPPYYTVIFSSVRTPIDEGYLEMALRMEDLARKQDGFLGFESAREEFGISISYWKDLKSISKWKENFEHVIAQKKGQEKWYKSYKVRIAKVEHEYGFNKEE